ncbi:non-canonical purine NTP pyrophosphatase [Candidatus Micrarchaeota archaeon]|nr:non-canonical purine NTP pyrophosphatase [Candidatus Micrarchaeota archaeon]
MKKILTFVSSNPEKIKEVRFVLSHTGIPCRSQRMHLNEPRLESPEAVALAKARYAHQRLHVPIIAEDTSIYFKAYPLFPGLYAAYAYDALGLEGLLKLLNGKPRGALFKTAVAYVDDYREKTFIGTCMGRISRAASLHGVRGLRFPYERLFIPNGRKKLLSEMSAKEKAEISHRRKALEKFANWFITNEPRR